MALVIEMSLPRELHDGCFFSALSCGAPSYAAAAAAAGDASCPRSCPPPPPGRFPCIFAPSPQMDAEEERELNLVIRYFCSFGDKDGRDGLTLQVSARLKAPQQ